MQNLQIFFRFINYNYTIKTHFSIANETKKAATKMVAAFL